MPLAARVPDAAGAHTDAEALWVQFRLSIRAFVARRVSNPADVDDLVQRVFLQVHRHLGRIRSGERIHAWLYTTARRAITDHYRSHQRRREWPAGDAADLDALRTGPGSRPGDGEEREEVAACLAPLVERLGPADREAIGLIEIQELQVSDAAVRSGISLTAMKSRVRRARRRLRQAMLECCRIALDGRGMPIACASRTATRRSECAGSAS